MTKIQLISTVDGAKKRVMQILLSHSTVGLCCKLGHQDHVALIAISTDDGHVYVFDVKSGREMFFVGGLCRILQSSDVLKVMHGCAESIAALYQQHGIHLRHVFDTQVAYSVVLQCEDLPPRVVSLPVLCHKTGLPQYQPDCKLMKLLKEDLDVWMRRPLTNELLNFIATDVIPLFPLLYIKLTRAIHPPLIPWFEAMNREQIQSGYQPIKVHKIRQARIRLEEKETAKCKPSTTLTKRQRLLLSNTMPIIRAREANCAL